MTTTINQFQEKLLESFKTANKNIINRIGGVIIEDKLYLTVRSKKEGKINCINAANYTIKPATEKHKMIIEEVFVGYDAEGSRWSDHMGGHVIDCTGKNVTEAIGSIVIKLNELVKEA